MHQGNDAAPWNKKGKTMQTRLGATYLLACQLFGCDGRTDTVADLSPPASDPCPGQLAAQIFRNALCSCADARFAGGLHSDAFDSSADAAPGSALARVAGVGVNATFDTSARLDLQSDLTVAGPLPVLFADATSIQGDLRIGGPLSYRGQVAVEGSAWLAGDLTSLEQGTLHVAGDLRQATGAARGGANSPAIEGSDLREAVSIAAPCACGPTELIAVSALVAAAKLNNDNAESGLDVDRLRELFGDSRIELTGSRLFVSRIDSTGDVTLVVNQRSALFVDGNVSALGGLTFELGPDGELDLFIGGKLALLGTALGDPRRPARLRVYVAGDEVTLSGSEQLAFNLYAPHAAITIVGSHDFYGALFVANFVAMGDTELHYDRAVITQAGSCAPAQQLTTFAGPTRRPARAPPAGRPPDPHAATLVRSHAEPARALCVRGERERIARAAHARGWCE
jgi:hypothetical protein